MDNNEHGNEPGYEPGASATPLARIRRPRRLRTTPAMRALVAETAVLPSDLILPLFVADGLSEARSISSMPGVVQHTFDSLRVAAAEAVAAGVGALMLFGVPTSADKDARGSAADRPEGVLNKALALLAKDFGDDAVLIADTCLDEFTDHGHCGVLDKDGKVDNDATLARYQSMAIAQTNAGATVLGPSGMMDGQVAAIRAALDAENYFNTAILAYSAKYASAFYGPFRDAVDSSLAGDRRSYQQNYANRRESLVEVQLDIAEGADMVMVKPAMSYLDVVADIAAATQIPVAAYQVSGEYSMITAAAERGWIDREAAISESVTSIKRAGASVVITYFATELAQRLTRKAK